MKLILNLIYGFGGLSAIFCAVQLLSEILRKKRSFSDRYIGIKEGIIFAFLVAFIPLYWVIGAVTGNAAEGHYQTTAICYVDGSGMTPVALPAEISIHRDVWDDGVYEYIYLDKLLSADGNDVLYSGSDEVEANQDSVIFLDSCDLIVNIGDITNQALGVSIVDEWESEGTINNILNLLAFVSAALMLIQFLISLKKQAEKM